MDLVTRLNQFSSLLGSAFSGFPGLSLATRYLLDENNDIAIDGAKMGSYIPHTRRVRITAAQLQALGAVANGDVAAFILPPGAVVLSSTVKHAVSPNGGKATGTLTSNNTNVTVGDTVTIGGEVYTFVTTVAVAGDVKRGASADASLLNLLRAINNSGGTPGAGNDYLVTAANASVTAATSVTSHAFAVTAIANGSAGNSIATVTTNAGPTLSWGGATLAGGGTSVATATARLISAQNNYGTAFDVAQAPGAEVVDFFATPKNELMGSKSTINLHVVITGTTLDLVQVGTIDAWCTYFLRAALPANP